MLSPEAQSLAGRRAAPSLERRFGGIVEDSAAVARMDRIGSKLAHALPEYRQEWHYALLRSDQINAFSLPGGLIYVTQGLYRRISTDDELLAAGIAHEMSHVLSRDSLKPPCTCAEESLQREIDADAGAISLLKAASYPASAMDRLLVLTADVQPGGWSEDRRVHLPVRDLTMVR
jgi:predicted Zn-dependent protease